MDVIKVERKIFRCENGFGPASNKAGGPSVWIDGGRDYVVEFLQGDGVRIIAWDMSVPLTKEEIEKHGKIIDLPAPPNLNDLNQAIKDLCAKAGWSFDMQTDNHGQIVLYTGLMVKAGSEEQELVPFQEQEDELDL